MAVGMIPVWAMVEELAGSEEFGDMINVSLRLGEVVVRLVVGVGVVFDSAALEQPKFSGSLLSLAFAPPHYRYLIPC